MNLSFFLGSRCLGSCPAKPLITTPQGPIHMVSSYAFFCPRCGEIWGRVFCDHKSSLWAVKNRPCAKCDLRNNSAWMSDAGSFLDPHWWQGSALQIDNPELPDDVVRWEFQVILPKLLEQPL